MKTKIYESARHFHARPETELFYNGVTQEFADANPGWDVETGNTSCWCCANCTDCTTCTDCRSCEGCCGCYSCTDCKSCYSCTDCKSCYSCTDCKNCTTCESCINCYDCTSCADCIRSNDLQLHCSGAAIDQEIPVIEDIHTTVLEAVRQPGALDMRDWHTCDTIHCRAGWVTHLAGAAGRELEDDTSAEFAAMLIYQASSPIQVSPRRFYESDMTAMKDMERCALEEQAALLARAEAAEAQLRDLKAPLP